MLQQEKEIMVYTDHPESYHNAELLKNMKAEFCSCPRSFCGSMLQKDYSGLILDMRKIMNTPCGERNKILSFSATVPTMRSFEKANKALFLDDKNNFICNCENQCCHAEGGSCPVNVQIPVQISLDDDPVMSRHVTGTIHHISETGCTFHTDAQLDTEEFLHLKIYSLKNKLPIYTGILQEQDNRDCYCGYKVKFLYIKEDQLQEIKENYID